MSVPDPVPKQGEGFGLTSYRIVVTLALAYCVFALANASNKLDHTAELAITLNSRLDAQADRIKDHDRRIGKLEDWRDVIGGVQPRMGNP